MRRSWTIAVLAGVAAVVLCGCGGGGDDGPTEASYLARADAVCAKFVPAPRSGNEDLRAVAPELRADVAARRRVYDGVGRLEPPAPLRARVKAFLAANDAYLAALGEQARIAARGDTFGYQAQGVAASQAVARRARLAAQIGFKRCGQPVRGQGAPLTPVGFLPAVTAAAADADCKRATDVTVATRPKSTSAADIQATYAVNAPAARAAYRRLAELEVPAANAAVWDEFLRAFDARVKEIEDARDRGRPGPATPGLYDREVALTRRLGLVVCGQSTTLGV